MPRFHIDIDSADLVTYDSAGLEFPDAAAACREAISGGAEIIADELKRGSTNIDLKLHINDAEGVRIKTVRISALITID